MHGGGVRVMSTVGLQIQDSTQLRRVPIVGSNSCVDTRCIIMPFGVTVFEEKALVMAVASATLAQWNMRGQVPSCWSNS